MQKQGKFEKKEELNNGPHSSPDSYLIVIYVAIIVSDLAWLEKLVTHIS